MVNDNIFPMIGCQLQKYNLRPFNLLFCFLFHPQNTICKLQWCEDERICLHLLWHACSARIWKNTICNHSFLSVPVHLHNLYYYLSNNLYVLCTTLYIPFIYFHNYILFIYFKYFVYFHHNWDIVARFHYI